MSTKKDSASAIAAKAADLIEHGWCQFTFARDAEGDRVAALDSEAVAWCAWGAIRRAASDTGQRRSREYLTVLTALRQRVDDGVIQSWNDNPHQTAAGVASTLRALADVLRTEEQA